MTGNAEAIAPKVAVKRAVLTKRQNGVVFERVEMADGKPARVLERVPGIAPLESYADLPGPAAVGANTEE